MRHRLKARISYANVMATLAVIVAIGGGAFAVGAIPDSGGEIDACYIKRGSDRGQVRLLLRGSCNKAREKPISWNQEGPIGARGPAGAPGAEGAQGPPGDPGPAGSIAGAPAGGDLTGSYPSPLIAPDAISADGSGGNGSTKLATSSVDTQEVQNNSLTGSDINESMLQLGVATNVSIAGNATVEVADMGTAGTVDAWCTVSGTLRGLNLILTAATNGVRTTMVGIGSGGALGDILDSGEQRAIGFGVSDSADVERMATISTLVGSDIAEAHIYALTKPNGGSGCEVWTRVIQ